MEIHAYIKGNYFRKKENPEAGEIFAALEEGDELRLEAEPENPYDPNAVRVHDAETGTNLGFVQKEVSPLVADMLKKGPVTAKVYSLMGGCMMSIESAD